jgi:uncharacterized membrane protein
MILLEFIQAVWSSTADAGDALTVASPLAGPAPEPPAPSINTDAIVNFFATTIAPILLAILGVIFIGRAGKGEISKVLTSSAIAIVGLAFIAGAGVLFFFGTGLIDLFFD